MTLKTTQLSGGYGDSAIVRDIDLALNNGEWLSILGANGSGKSTLLRLMGRILAPQQGAVLLDGKAIHDLPLRQVAKQMAILPQHQIIPPGLTVEQLVSLGRAPHRSFLGGEPTAEGRQQIEAAMVDTGVIDYRTSQVSCLSGGEKQRVFLALALAQNPRVLLLDEPTTYLDLHYQLQLLDLLSVLNTEQDISVVTILHDVNLAARYSDRLALLKNGELFAVGQPTELLTAETLAAVFGISAIVLDTPVGIQICPVSNISSISGRSGVRSRSLEPMEL